MDKHPPEPLVAHELPPAPSFFGRDRELEELRRAWASGFCGVLALVGLGGAGKTALAARFLEELCRQPGPLPPCDGLLAWSFYRNQDAGGLLQEACAYFCQGPAAGAARGLGLLHLLAGSLLARGGRYLIVLDGLERVQQTGDRNPADYGRLDDPLLKTLLVWAAAKSPLVRADSGIGNTMILITSRFTLTELEALDSPGYRQLALGELDQASGLALLRSRGVRGDDEALRQLIETYGAHALTLDHLGGLIGQFLDGDASRAPQLAPESQTADRQGLRLARLLDSYEQHLPPAELTLLSRLCLLRRPAPQKQVVEMLVCSPWVRPQHARELAEVIARCPGGKEFERHELAGIGRAIAAVVEAAALAAPLAGRVEAFRRDLIDVCEKTLQLGLRADQLGIDKIVRLYASQALDTVTAERPLDEADRRRLHGHYANYIRLRHHDPDLPFKAALSPQWLRPEEEEALYRGEDISPASAFRILQNLEEYLGRLALKHGLLVRVHELCRRYQEKWSLAGPLAPLDAGSLGQLLNSLVNRHLVLREAGGMLSVHPAVRDHFQRLVVAASQGKWHDMIRQQLTNLVRRPGTGPVEDQASLDLVEDAIFHAVEAGHSPEAEELYRELLGGHKHLAWKLGEMARGLRILRMFQECPSRWALAWFLRALGELDEAYRQHTLPYFRADIRLLEGRLPLVAAEDDHHRSSLAAFLMGASQRVPDVELGCAIPLGQLYLYLGQLEAARRVSQVKDLYDEFGWEGDRSRALLVLAEVALREGDWGGLRQWLQEAEEWIVHAGSVEHLAALHLVRARGAQQEPDLPTAGRAVDDGLHIARQFGLRLHLVELLCEQARLQLASADPVSAERSAREALDVARSEDCRFAWGAADAGHLLGEALNVQGRRDEARGMLAEALDVRRSLSHPGADRTLELLQRLA